MVDAVISFVVEKLGDALIGETFFLHSVRSQVERLRDELIRMQCFLKDADAREQQGDEGVRNWIAEIRNVAYDAEDVIDTFILKANSTCKTKTGVKNFLTRNAWMVKNLGHLHRVGYEILAIQARLKAISDSRVTYGIKELSGKETSSSETNQRMIQHPLRNRYSHVEDNEVIGFEEHTETLISELMKDEERRCVISIVGVGGLGKTTLAKKIYKHDTIKNHFDCCGWSSISQQLNVQVSLGDILKNCMTLTDNELQMLKAMSATDLVEKLYNYLQDKRYFVVMDDVWKFDHWNTLSPAFPTGKRGSKVLLTTRNKDVALQVDPWSLHFQPQHLTDAESWELLCKKAFPDNTTGVNSCPARLEKLGREMVRKCGGLPLAICVLGGLLATKRSESKQWELVHRDVISYISNGENGGVMGILALSYHDLPCHLKPCFLYLGLFPEDYAIPRKKLIPLWIAEGFIPHAQEKLHATMEDIAKHEYLAELTQRCMVQVSYEFFVGEGMIKTYRIHDLMRDLCVSEGKAMNFLDIHNQQQHCTSGVTSTNAKKLRRYVVHPKSEAISRYEIHFSNSDSRLRTLLFLVPWGTLLTPLNCQNYKLLRVLHLENVLGSKKSLAKEVFKLIHLRYLSLGISSNVPISSSIGNLRSLQTLELPFFNGTLPETASRLVQLRHLNLFLCSADQKFRIENLMNLQSMGCIKAGSWIRKGCLDKLSNLRKLSVCSTSRLQTDIILEEVVGKPSSLYQSPIRKLGISSIEKLPNSIFDSLSCCHNLHTLTLGGRLDAINLHKYPQNLRKLHLSGSMLEEDPITTVQYLPNLKDLSLQRVYEGEEMVCSSTGFPQLQILTFTEHKNLKEWRVDQGGMPHLKYLTIMKCRKLSMLPDGLRFITSLEQLNILGMPLVKDRIVKGVGEDWYKVQHVPSITAQ